MFRYFILMILLLHSISLFARNQALLVGIGEYKNLPPTNFLEGPKYDIPALQQVLKEKWGFKLEDIKLLQDKQATKKNIMDALEAIYAKTEKGDHVVFYYSGHGTSVFDKSLGIAVPHGSGAIVPYDGNFSGKKKFVLDSLIIGRYDLVPRLKRLDDGGRHVSVFFDSCFSGNAVRGLFSRLDKSRPPKLKHRQVVTRITDNKITVINTASTPPTAPSYPYKNVFFLSAASDREYADDINEESLPWYPTIDNKPHGAFTDALLRALNGKIPVDSNKDKDIEYEELYKAIQVKLLAGGHRQTPQSLPPLKEDVQNLRYRKIFLSDKYPLKPKETKINAAFSKTDLKVRLNEPRIQAKIEALKDIRVVQKNANIVVIKKNGHYILLNNASDKLAEVNNLNSLIQQLKQRAWFHQISQKSLASQPFHFSFELAQSVRGNTFRLGELINFNVKSNKDIWLVLLYISSDGDITTLYPYYHHETKKIQAKKLFSVPKDDAIEVTLPIGTDQVIALAFSRKPTFLNQLIGKDILNIQGDLMKKIHHAVKNNGHDLAIRTLEIHTIF